MNTKLYSQLKKSCLKTFSHKLWIQIKIAEHPFKSGQHKEIIIIFLTSHFWKTCFYHENHTHRTSEVSHNLLEGQETPSIQKVNITMICCPWRNPVSLLTSCTAASQCTCCRKIHNQTLANALSYYALPWP